MARKSIGDLWIINQFILEFKFCLALYVKLAHYVKLINVNFDNLYSLLNLAWLNYYVKSTYRIINIGSFFRVEINYVISQIQESIIIYK